MADFMAGAAGGAAGVLTGAPMDVLRIRQQTCSGKRAVSLWAHLASIRQREGVRALFRGVSFPLATAALQNAVTFQAYGLAWRWLECSAQTNVCILLNLLH